MFALLVAAIAGMFLVIMFCAVVEWGFATLLRRVEERREDRERRLVGDEENAMRGGKE